MAFKPSDDQRRIVQVMRANGVPIHVIARNVVAGGIDEKTLHKHFAAELQHGLEQVRAELAGVVVQCGMRGDWRAAIAWLQRFGGPEWKLSSDDFRAMAAANDAAGVVVKIIGGLPAPTPVEAIDVESREPPPAETGEPVH